MSIGTECAAILSEMHFVLVQRCVAMLSVGQLVSRSVTAAV